MSCYKPISLIRILKEVWLRCTELCVNVKTDKQNDFLGCRFRKQLPWKFSFGWTQSKEISRQLMWMKAFRVSAPKQFTLMNKTCCPSALSGSAFVLYLPSVPLGLGLPEPLPDFLSTSGRGEALMTSLERRISSNDVTRAAPPPPWRIDKFQMSPPFTWELCSNTRLLCATFFLTNYVRHPSPIGKSPEWD